MPYIILHRSVAAISSGAVVVAYSLVPAQAVVVVVVVTSDGRKFPLDFHSTRLAGCETSVAGMKRVIHSTTNCSAFLNGYFGIAIDKILKQNCRSEFSS